MKDTIYFSHDCGARNDPKLQKVLKKLGHTGKSIYWDLIEMIYEEGGFLLLKEIDSYAFALRTESEVIKSLINDDFDLFEKDDVKFWSNSALERLKKRDEKSKKASESALVRWNNANAMRTQCNGNAKKKKKVNKIKVKESKFRPPTIEEIKNYGIEKGYNLDADKIFNYYDVNNWKDSKGSKVKNWKQKVLSVWCKDENKIKQDTTKKLSSW